MRRTKAQRRNARPVRFRHSQSLARRRQRFTAYIDAHNAEPKPFRWTKTADDILAAVQRFCQRTIDVQARCLETSEAGQ
jgi:hypothetical protein